MHSIHHHCGCKITETYSFCDTRNVTFYKTTVDSQYCKKCTALLKEIDTINEKYSKNIEKLKKKLQKVEMDKNNEIEPIYKIIDAVRKNQ